MAEALPMASITPPVTSVIKEEKKRVMVHTDIVNQGISISDFYGQVEKIFAKAFAKDFWLIAEVESIAYRKSAVYVTLVEKNEHGVDLTINALLWQGKLRELFHKHGQETVKDILQEGLKLCLLCQVNFIRGQVSLLVKDLNQCLPSALALEKEGIETT